MCHNTGCCRIPLINLKVRIILFFIKRWKLGNEQGSRKQLFSLKYKVILLKWTFVGNCYIEKKILQWYVSSCCMECDITTKSFGKTECSYNRWHRMNCSIQSKMCSINCILLARIIETTSLYIFSFIAFKTKVDIIVENFQVGGTSLGHKFKQKCVGWIRQWSIPEF